MRKQRKRLATLLLAFLLWLGLPGIAEAHIFLERSEPAPESLLTEPPDTIQVQFNRPIKTNLSQLWLADHKGQTIPAELTAQEKKLVLIPPPLAEGEYEVHWRVMGLNAYVAEGAYRFTIGHEESAAPPALLDSSFLGNLPQSGGTAVWVQALKGLELLAVLTVAGWVLFRLFLWNEQEDQALGISPQERQAWERRLLAWAMLLLVITGGGQIGQKAYLFHPQLDLQFGEIAWAILTTTFLGIAVVARILFLLLLYFLASRGHRDSLGRFVLVMGILITYLFTGNAYHSQMILPHLLHLLASAFWLSGLVGFSLYVFRHPKESMAVQYLHQRFQMFLILALGMMALVIGTGVYLSRVFVGKWINLFETSYGYVLLGKLGLFLLLLLVAAWNRWVWFPSLKQKYSDAEGSRIMRAILWGVRTQLMVAWGIILLTVILSHITPPGNIHQGHEHGGVRIFLGHTPAEQGRDTVLFAYVLNRNERLSNAEVVFDVWDKEYEDLFIDIQNYCSSNNMRFDVFREALIERGFIREIRGVENKDHVYMGQLELPPGLWNVSVRVEHQGQEVFKYQNFTVEIKESSG